MKIAQIVCVYPPYRGGIGSSAKVISDLLISIGQEVFNFTPKYKYKQRLADNQHENNLILLPPMIEYGNATIMPGLFGELAKFDIVIFHYPFFGTDIIMALYLMLKKKNFKLVIFYHMDVAVRSLMEKIMMAPFRIVKRYLFKKADIILASTLDYVKSGDEGMSYGKFKNKLYELPFSVDIKKYVPQKNKHENNFCQILFVGGLDRQHYFKGLGILIDSLAMLKGREMPGWKLKVVGSGELLREYREQAQKFGILEKINFAGNLSDEDKIKAYQESDFFILPSINKNEAFGIVLLEAMASGIPVIATELPGVRQVFQDDVQGFYVKIKDRDDLKNKILTLLNDSALRIKMGKEARILAENKYCLEKLKDNLAELLKRLMNN